MAIRLSPDAVTVLGLLVALTVPYWSSVTSTCQVGVVALPAGLIDNLDGAGPSSPTRVPTPRLRAGQCGGPSGGCGATGRTGLAATNPGPLWARLCLPSCRSTPGAPRGWASPRSGVISLSERPTRVLVAGCSSSPRGPRVPSGPRSAAGRRWSWGVRFRPGDVGDTEPTDGVTSRPSAASDRREDTSVEFGSPRFRIRATVKGRPRIASPGGVWYWCSSYACSIMGYRERENRWRCSRCRGR